jgi:hypothetical protein
VGDIANPTLAPPRRYLVRCRHYWDVHGVLLYQHGSWSWRIFLGTTSGARTSPFGHESVVGVLAGIAVDTGAISGVGARVLPSMK